MGFFTITWLSSGPITAPGFFLKQYRTDEHGAYLGMIPLIPASMIHGRMNTIRSGCWCDAGSTSRSHSV
jgi:hypothetical protein